MALLKSKDEKVQEAAAKVKVEIDRIEAEKTKMREKIKEIEDRFAGRFSQSDALTFNVDEVIKIGDEKEYDNLARQKFYLKIALEQPYTIDKGYRKAALKYLKLTREGYCNGYEEMDNKVTEAFQRVTKAQSDLEEAKNNKDAYAKDAYHDFVRVLKQQPFCVKAIQFTRLDLGIAAMIRELEEAD